MKSKLTRFKEEYLIQLGRIVVNMNKLEFYTSSSIFLLTSEHHTISQQYYILMSVIGNQRFGRIIQALDTVFKTKVDDSRLIKKFNSLKDKANSLYNKRNTYVHSMWLFAEDDTFVSRMKNLKFPKVETQYQPTVKELSSFADELQSCAGELMSFIHDVTIRLERKSAMKSLQPNQALKLTE